MADRTPGDLRGTGLAAFLIDAIASTAVRLKNVAGVLRFRNKADDADVAIVASKLSASGDVIELNEDAASSGADWPYTLQRPSTGMTEAIDLVFPPDFGTDGFALFTDGAGETYWGVAAGGEDKAVYDETDLAFGDSSPVAMFTLPANATGLILRVIVDTAFNGTAPTLSIGVSGTTSKFMSATAIDLKTAGIYEVDTSAVATSGSTQAVIATYSADSSSAGAARIIFGYVIAS